MPSVEPKVSIIVPTRDQPTLLARCVHSILHETSYGSIELVIIDNGSDERDTLAFLSDLTLEPRVNIIRDARPFNYSALNNQAARGTIGDILVLMNDDVEAFIQNG